ncbi:flagellar hook-associated protein FlgK [Cohnella nanjingensis]|uniref:Flagellar hook-associated protein 1 n=1 Tax=Cohnella nanjingensis TaxID=1387779 RepID=A0A7X0RQ03_9BACL|nr:flagellar hook-associated protein FlgK [Cohnella nanjingensis]MBB6671522.1 flagellar hook-associated protein FlgK [Cohnella nanjingensis]
MRSTFHSLETVKRALFTQQAALSTTGQNIANANTAGYSRQIVNMQATRPIEAPGMTHSTIPGQLGTGVEFTSITRVREQFLDTQYRNQNMDTGNWTFQASALDKLEAIFNEPSDTGLRSLMDKFWTSWSDLSKDPENVTGRKIVRENALALADTFNLTSKQLSDMKSDLTANIGTKANQINTYLSNIADLNQQITRISAYGDNANDLMDQRDLLTDKLSQLVNITVTDSPQGYNISMGGVELLNGFNAATVDAAGLEAAFAGGNGGDLRSGEVYGMLVARDTYVTQYQQQLDTLANSLANGEFTVTLPAGTVLPNGITLDGVTYNDTNRKLASDLTVKIHGVNELHKLGYTMKDPVTTGVDFFTSKDGGPITAASLTLNKIIQDSPDAIATSMRTDGTPEKVVPGNNTLALIMSNLKDTKFTFVSPDGSTPVVGRGTIDDFYQSVIGQLGVQSENAQRQVENQNSLLANIDNQRQSVSGVSLDEEMSNLIKFQHAYSAAARAMTAYDEILDKVINGMGIVGR